jgi:tRNA A37 N6-isopentenylltransferase MiaA
MARSNARDLRDRGIFATRQLAKRQLTWLRATGRDLRPWSRLDAGAGWIARCD